MAQSPEQQFKPLFPFITSSSSPFTRQEDQNHNSEQKHRRIRNSVLCCGCVSAFVVIAAVIILVLGFTVYNVKQPEVKMNRVTLLNGTFGTMTNVTLLADISVKNTNAVTFRFKRTNTTIYYEGVGVGKGTAPAGKVKARRTVRFNSTLEIVSKKLLDIPSLTSDLSDQALNMSSYSRLVGKVKILNVFAKKVVIEMNCTFGYNTTTGVITNGDNCLGLVDI